MSEQVKDEILDQKDTQYQHDQRDDLNEIDDSFVDEDENEEDIKKESGDEDENEEDIKKESGDEDDQVFSQEILDEASAYGLNHDQISKQFQSEEELRKNLDFMDSIIIKRGQEFYQQQNQNHDQQNQNHDQQNQNHDQQNQNHDGDFKTFESGLNPEKYSDPEQYDPIIPELIKTVKSLEGFINQNLKNFNSQFGDLSSVKTQFGELIENLSAQQQGSFMERFDGMIEKLGDEYVPVFGKGESLDLAENSTERGNRQKIVETMRVLAAGYEQNGSSVPPLNILFKKALRLEFADKVSAQNKADKKEKANKRSKKIGYRPRSRTYNELSAEERAARRVDDFHSEKGITDSDDGEFEI
jgi:hypothetical protein